MLALLGLIANYFDASHEMAEYEMQDLIGKINLRKQAKSDKNWAEADAIRNELINQGLQLLDNKDGTTSVEKDGVEIVRV